MKKIILLFSFSLLFIATSFAQSFPSGINYQAVARNTEGDIISNKDIGIKISFFTSSDRSQSTYSEVHRITTNSLGLFDIVVGQGKALTSKFDQIPWATEEVWIDIAVDDKGSSNYQSVSTSRLFAVPYAIHSLTADKISGTRTEKAGFGNDATGPSPCQPLLEYHSSDHYMTVECDGDVVVKNDLKVDDALRVDKNVTLNATGGSTNIKGQTTITKTNLGSNQNNYNDYALRVESRHQGMAVKLTGSSNPTRNNNWMTFFAANGSAKGRIEGFNGLTGLSRQTVKDMIDRDADEPASEDADPGPPPVSAAQYFNNDYAVGALSETLDLINGIIKVFTNSVACAAGLALFGDCDDVVWSIIDAVVQGVQLGGYIAYNELNLGATFESGGADYAEWLQKENKEEMLAFGEVVGIVGGNISKSFVDADKFMVISQNPGVIGAMPDPEREDEYGVVAFMGQVPVKVIGDVKKGDYILPSGNGDGMAIAVARDQMKARDFERIVGIAWSESEPDKIFNYIRTAVGINSNDLSAMVEQMQVVMNEMQRVLQELDPEYNGHLFDVDGNLKLQEGEYTKSLTMNQMARQGAPTGGFQTQEEAMQYVKQFASEQGFDLHEYPYLAELVDNPNDIEMMKKAQTHYQAVLKDIMAIYTEINAGD